MNHPLLRTAEIRAIEARGLASTPPGTLMRRAAAALGQVCAQHLRRLPAGTTVLALVGPGNNGGDALLAALWLQARGYRVQAMALSPVLPTASDARQAWSDWATAGQAWLRPDQLEAWLQACRGAPALVIDGLFGIGLQRPLEGSARAIVESLCAHPVIVIAADVPSGIDADTGAVVGPAGSIAMRAAATVTFIADKPGLRTGAGLVHAGTVVRADLGLDAGAVQASELIDREAARRWARPRARDAHKGSHGDVLVIRGAPHMQGASILALLGAQAVGAGKLFLGIDGPDPVFTPSGLQDQSSGSATDHGRAYAPVDPQHPEFMRRALPPVHEQEPVSTLQAWGPADALVVGCGLGTDARAHRIVLQAILHPGALVLDADGLNVLAQTQAGAAALMTRAHDMRMTVITPHPLEAARLLRTTTEAVQRDRIGAAQRLVQLTGAVTVLKGAGTIIAWPATAPRASGKPPPSTDIPQAPTWAINGSGGPLLAVAGTGDVLAGIIAGLLAQGLEPPEAACLGTWLHGAGADSLTAHAQWAGGIGLAASRLPEAVRAVINQLAADRSEA